MRLNEAEINLQAASENKRKEKESYRVQMESCRFTCTSQQSLGSGFSSGHCLPSRSTLRFDNPGAGKAMPLLSPHKIEENFTKLSKLEVMEVHAQLSL